jgi:sporulation protein YlmC with PRC-barrel domain
MPQKNDSGEIITTDDILGKFVIDNRGAIVGQVEKINVDPHTLEIKSITVDKGLLRMGLTIGKDYIRTVSPHAVLLSIRPVHDFKHMKVFDNKGRLIGTVTHVDLVENKNKIDTLQVKSGTKTIHVQEQHIKNIGTNVLLNVEKSELEHD